MTEAPKKIWTFYDPEFDANYWKEQTPIHPIRDFVGEYILAAEHDRIVAEARIAERDLALVTAAEKIGEMEATIERLQRIVDAVQLSAEKG